MNSLGTTAQWVFSDVGYFLMSLQKEARWSFSVTSRAQQRRYMILQSPSRCVHHQTDLEHLIQNPPFNK